MPKPLANPKEVTGAVAECVRSKREVLAEYVFGSVATGRTRKDSDVDVAVLLRDGISRARTLQYRLNLIADLGGALHRSDVDVVILNEASPLLAHRVLSKGKLVFERSGILPRSVSGHDRLIDSSSMPESPDKQKFIRAVAKLL